LNLRTFGRMLGAATLVALSTPALSATGHAMTPSDIMSMSTSQYQRLARGKSSRVGTAGIDRTGPVMTRLNLVTAVNAERADAQVVYDFAATDNVSGVRWLGVVLVGPSGQQLTSFTEVGLPRKSVSGKGTLNIPLLPEPGNWTVTEIRGQDEANNLFQTPLDLNTLGNMHVAIQNRHGHDAVPPALNSGKILTPVVSLSVPAKGTESAGPLVGLSVSLADSGTTTIAGINWVAVEMCIPDQEWYCLYMNASTGNVRGLKAVALMPYTVTDPVTTQPGLYAIRSINVSDHSGNEQTLTSVLFGGETDFNALFIGTTIEITP
jgi:hypothetical protein